MAKHTSACACLRALCPAACGLIFSPATSLPITLRCAPCVRSSLIFRGELRFRFLEDSGRRGALSVAAEPKEKIQ